MKQSEASKPKRSLRLPVSLRSPKQAQKLLQTFVDNIWQEVRYAANGMRRVALWRDDEQFVRLWRECRTFTLLSPAKFYKLYQLAQNAKQLTGDFAELGVFRGGSAMLLAEVLGAHSTDRKLHLFDTFKGLPEADAQQDLHEKGDLASTDFDSVKRRFVNRPVAEFHVGLFSETLPRLTSERFALAHIDADLHSSVWECCEYLYPRIVQGGFLIFDDYGFLSCPGAREAVDTFFSDKPESPIYLSTGQCLVVRQSSS